MPGTCTVAQIHFPVRNRTPNRIRAATVRERTLEGSRVKTALRIVGYPGETAR